MYASRIMNGVARSSLSPDHHEPLFRFSRHLMEVVKALVGTVSRIRTLHMDIDFLISA